MKKMLLDPRALRRTLALLIILLAAIPLWAAPSLVAASSQKGQQPVAQARTPSDTVREFYRLMRERRFREAFMLTIYASAVTGLSQQEFDDLRPDFERQALDAPEKVDLTGEQISGDDATVFMKLGGEADERDVKIIPIFLIREKRGAWIIGDRDDLKLVNKRGKRFFFEARIEAHHDVVEGMMKRISTAQLVHAAQNGGAFGDLQALVRAGLIPQDITTPHTTGYNFRVTPAQGGRAWSAQAEPARYGHTGRLSFYIDNTGALRKEDKGGKPLKGT